MQKFWQLIWPLLLIASFAGAQNNRLDIRAKLHPALRGIDIQQRVTFYNTSNDVLDTLYFHNWANAYKDKKTPLAKRLLEAYDRSFFFAKLKNRGSSKIESLTANRIESGWFEPEGSPDIVGIPLHKPLHPGDSVLIDISYVVKVPLSKYTKYGFKDNDYHLRYWYITPAVYDGKWQLMNNLDMDDLYMSPTDYHISFNIPSGYRLYSDLDGKIDVDGNRMIYELYGKNRGDIEVTINLLQQLPLLKTDKVDVITDMENMKLSKGVKTDVLNRQLSFISDILGDYPHKKMFVSSITYKKNPVYGLNQLPRKFAPFTDVFEWDITVFKALTREYLENTLFVNHRTDYWLVDGIQIYLMMKYVDKFYPEVKATGNISKIWGFRSYALAKLDFNGKYPFVYQFAARKNLDQALTTRGDSLSNFNFKIVNKYKAGLGLRYMESYLNDSTVARNLKRFYNDNVLKLANSRYFMDHVRKEAPKDISFFFGDYLKTTKKIDYTIKDFSEFKDSIRVNIVNLNRVKAPMALYGVKDRDILYKKWFKGIDSTLSITIPKTSFDRLALNYEYIVPELNLRNNWKKIDKKLFNRPLKFTFFKDIEDPYYNQIFYNVFFEYNYYDGLILGPQLYNQSIFKKKWLYAVTPAYGFKSKSLIGSFAMLYNHYPDNKVVYRYRVGISGSKSHYDRDLSFVKFNPFFIVDFNRKSLRDVGGSSLMFRFNMVDKEIPKGVEKQESDSYNVLNIRYSYSQPNIIDDIRYTFDVQFHRDFAKTSIDLRYRKLTDKNRQLDFRVFFGTFLFNKTNTDFFSFALDRPNDYLFEYNYLGRSEETGFLSQQIIISEGGFKSKFNEKYANQWMLSTNISVSIWRWIEAYADAGFIKDQQYATTFRYDTGIRLNIVHNFLEIYFPMQSSLGFEPAMENYFSRIRYVVILDPVHIYNYIRRGFY